MPRPNKQIIARLRAISSDLEKIHAEMQKCCDAATEAGTEVSPLHFSTEAVGHACDHLDDALSEAVA